MFNIFATLAPVLAQGGSGITADESWDLESFFNNATDYTQEIGGAFLAFIGICGLTGGGFFLVRKLFGGQTAQQDSWFKIVALILVGGAMLFGGMALLLNFAEGGKDTIENFGNGSGTPGTILVDQFNVIGAQFAHGATGLATHVPDVAAVLPGLL